MESLAEWILGIDWNHLIARQSKAEIMLIYTWLNPTCHHVPPWPSAKLGTAVPTSKVALLRYGNPRSTSPEHMLSSQGNEFVNWKVTGEYWLVKGKLQKAQVYTLLEATRTLLLLGNGWPFPFVQHVRSAEFGQIGFCKNCILLMLFVYCTLEPEGVEVTVGMAKQFQDVPSSKHPW